MKLKTHYIFSTGLISLILSSLHIHFFSSLFISLFVSVIGNSLIDRIGHKEMLTRRGYIPVRTPLTHTVPRSIAWGILSTLPLIAFLYYFDFKFVYLAGLIIAGVVVGPSHLLLDVFTEAGIFVKKNGKWKRFALAHFSYDNPAINGLAVLIGFLMLITSYYLSYHYLLYYNTLTYFL